MINKNMTTMNTKEITEIMRQQQVADDSMKCAMCDILGVAGPCKTHKDDPFAGVVDTCTDCRESVDNCECYTASECEI